MNSMNTQFTISRRRVLKGLSAGMAAAAAGPNLFSSRLWGAAAPGDRLNIALIGCGGQGRRDLLDTLGCRTNLIAVCDVDQDRIKVARDDVAKRSPELKNAAESARGYSDYRKLLQKEKALDGVMEVTKVFQDTREVEAAILPQYSEKDLGTYWPVGGGNTFFFKVDPRYPGKHLIYLKSGTPRRGISEGFYRIGPITITRASRS